MKSKLVAVSPLEAHLGYWLRLSRPGLASSASSLANAALELKMFAGVVLGGGGFSLGGTMGLDFA